MFTRLAYLIMALVLGVASIVLCRLTQATFVESGSSLVTGPAQVVVGYPIRAVSDLLQGIRGISELRSENERLRAELDRLHQEVAAMPEIQRENQLLREQLDLRRTRPTYQYSAGRIIGYDPNPLVKSIIINIGTRDGIADGMTVVTPQGIVGRVVRASPGTSKVLLVTDVSSSINGMLQTTRARGVVNGSSTGRLVMRYIGQSEVVHTGDRVITSGLGGNFPPGLLIGSVIDVRQKDVDMFQEARLEPAVDVDRLEQVLVITNFLPTKLE